jgi:hypothetical protein
MIGRVQVSGEFGDLSLELTHCEAAFDRWTARFHGLHQVLCLCTVVYTLLV